MATYSTLPYDVLHHLCIAVQATDSKTLKALSLTDKRTRSAVVPVLFYAMAFLSQWGEKDVPWEEVPQNINKLMEHAETISAVRRFVFQSWIAEPASHPIPQEFFALFSAFRNLTELKLLLQPEYFEQIRNELLGPNAAQVGNSDHIQVFSSVQSLTVPSPAWLELSPLFPNIRSLDIELLDAYTYEPTVVLDYAYLAKMHPNLKRLHLPEQGIDIVLKEIAQHLPNIEELGLFGVVDDWNGGCILQHLPSYAQLSKLYVLALPDESALGLGFYPPRCGNAYQQPGMREEVEKQRLEATTRLFEGIEAVLIRTQDGHKKGVLKELSLGYPRYGWDVHYLVTPDGKLKKATVK